MAAVAPAATTTLDTPERDNLSAGEIMVESLREYIRRYVALTDIQTDAIALWACHSHCFEAAECTPYLRITSTGPRCGKTRLLEVLELVVDNPWLTGRVTGPALVRKVDAEKPTLLLDETDATFTGGKSSYEILRGVLNTGYRLGGKTSYAVGGSYKDHQTFCPKAFAGIGDLPSTIMDRSIPVVMQRRDFEKVQRFRRRDAAQEARFVRARMARWAAAHLQALSEARPVIPSVLDDRSQDVWEPLLAIGDALSPEWGARARECAILLMADREAASEAGSRVGMRLLLDVRDVFTELDSDRVTTADLIARLLECDDGFWLDVDGKPVDPMMLADLLRAFSVAPDKIRFGRVVLQGYWRRSFADAWSLVEAPDVPAVVTTEEER